MMFLTSFTRLHSRWHEWSWFPQTPRNLNPLFCTSSEKRMRWCGLLRANGNLWCKFVSVAVAACSQETKSSALAPKSECRSLVANIGLGGVLCQSASSTSLPTCGTTPARVAAQVSWGQHPMSLAYFFALIGHMDSTIELLASTPLLQPPPCLRCQHSGQHSIPSWGWS